MSRPRPFGAFCLSGCLFLVATALLLAPTPLIAVDLQKSVIVMFKPDVMTLPQGLMQCGVDSAIVSLSTIEAILQNNGATSVAALVPGFDRADTLGVTRLGVEYKGTDWSRAFLIEVAAVEYVDSLVADLQGVAGVVYAEPAVIPVYADALPYAFPSPCTNDPVLDVGDQWQYQNFGLDAGGQLDPGTEDADIDLIEAWEITRGDADTMTVAVLDTGVWLEHADLAGKIRGNRLLDDDSEYHGTFIAGLIAAWANNSIAISGVSPYANIYAPIVMRQVQSPGFFQARLPQIVESMKQGQMPIANMSFSVDSTRTLTRSLSAAYNAGILLVASQTTEDRPEGVNYPARYRRPVLAVGYTDHNDNVPDFQLEADWVDVVAPGFEVISLLSWEAPQGVQVNEGTSFAAPLACGVASLLLSVRPDLDNDDLREVIVRSADDLGPSGWDETYGHGRLNAQRALEMVLFPNELYHGTTQGNNYVQGTTYIPSLHMIGPTSEWLAPATRYEVRRTVTFPAPYDDIPAVWGRGVPTDGYYTDNPNYAWRFCEVVPGSVTTSGCTLRTYVYERLQSSGTPYPDRMFTPSKSEDVQFAYTIVARGDHHYRIQSFVAPFNMSGVLYPMPEHWAVGCPGGDADTIVVKVALDATEFAVAPAKEEFTLSQPHNAKASLFPDCSTRIADYDAVLSTDPEFPNGCYKTSFRVANFGGFCGVDSLRVRFRGGLLGYVPINIRSPDMVSVLTSRANVSLADLSKFGEFYSSPPKAYNELADFVAPTDVGFADFSLFVYHYANGGHEYTPPSLTTGDEPLPHGSVVLQVSDGAPVNGQRAIVANVRVETSAGYEAALLAFRFNNPRLEFLGWQEASGYSGETICAEATVSDDRLLAIGLLGNKNECGISTVGVATFSVTGSDSLVLGDDDLAPVISDVLLLNGAEGAMSASTRHGASHRFTNWMGQNFPNPFNPQTLIPYSIAVAGKVELTVYDVSGRLVRQLVKENRVPGAYRVVWDGRDSKGNRVASGVYFYKLAAGRFTATRKLVLLK